jgi:hypothetical protein
MPSSHRPAGLSVAFDDDHAVANADLLLPATLADRLGIEAVIDELVNLGNRPGHHRPGRKVLTSSTRWWLVGTASTTPMCCAPGPPPRCSAIA